MDRSIKPQSPDLSSVCFETDNSQSASSINDNSNLPSTGSSDKKFFSGCSDGNKSKSFFENVTKVGVKNFPHSQSREFSKDKEKNAKLLSISDSHCVDTVKESKAFGKEQEKREQDVSVKEDYEHIGKAKTQDEIKMLDTGLLSLSYLSDSSQESEISKSRSNAHASIVKKPKKSKKAVWQGQSKAKLARPDANIFERELECAPTFRPMDQEFRDPMKYIRKMTPFILKYGICILVPPAGWQVRAYVSVFGGCFFTHVHCDLHFYLLCNLHAYLDWDFHTFIVTGIPPLQPADPNWDLHAFLHCNLHSPIIVICVHTLTETCIPSL